MSAIREQRIDLGGSSTRALELEGDGPPLVLLHGFSDSADTWRLLLSRLGRRGRRAIAVDLPGFGKATRMSRDERILPQIDRAVAALVEREAARNGAEGVVVVGNSLGGIAAFRAAQQDGLPVAGVVPIAPAGLDMSRWLNLIESAPLLRMLMRTPVPLPEVVVRQAVGRVYEAFAFAHPGQVDAGVTAAFTGHIRSRRDVVRIMATGRRLRPEIRNPYDFGLITCPVLVVWGERDTLVFPTGTERITREVAGARFAVIEDCGHCPQIEAPDRLAELLDEFPSGASGSGDPPPAASRRPRAAG
jgi:pimeloyl-ACP methyl ester carboxylesterase